MSDNNQPFEHHHQCHNCGYSEFSRIEMIDADRLGNHLRLQFDFECQRCYSTWTQYVTIEFVKVIENKVVID